MENNVKIDTPPESELSQDIEAYFERLWLNEDGNFTSDYEANEDMLTPVLKFSYWIQKLIGMTTY